MNLSSKNPFIGLQRKSIDWFLYDGEVITVNGLFKLSNFVNQYTSVQIQFQLTSLQCLYHCLCTNFTHSVYLLVNSQPTCTCSKLTIEIVNKCEICSKLSIKTPKRLFIVNLEHISHLVLVILLLTLNLSPQTQDVN